MTKGKDIAQKEHPGIYKESSLIIDHSSDSDEKRTQK